jgi:hypothetical protein
MRSGLISVIAALVCALLSSLEALPAAAADTAPRQSNSPREEMVLWHREPAGSWLEANLILGQFERLFGPGPVGQGAQERSGTRPGRA